MKEAMKARDKEKLATIRQILAEFKRFEVDNMLRDTGITDEQALDVLSKMLKQRVESSEIYQKEGREDLVVKEQAEIAVVKEFMPEPLTEAEVEQIIKETINTLGASSVKEMGSVMAAVKPKVQGRTDLKAVSGKIKSLLA